MRGAAEVAKRKASKPTPGRRPTAMTIKGSNEWRDWVDEGATF